ncbi:sorbitol dehydrogenase [Acrocarpospora pleiomorpha]|uniref:Sorbitol dehydrogenase n=1 Tax=Acrocarpospora pleiomorpha TaxID=90975 RepID=A0A5M3X6U8_9ACTN|nr:sorbitol dehydrogenase [Acrocarpospora pleiomorpha]
MRIRVAYAAICGSDPHLAEGFFGTDVPIGLGHEISGVIEALGERAHRNGLQVGDRVAGNFLRFCGTCRPCQDGRQQFCEHIQDYNRPGMAETITWHESQIYRLPDDVTLLRGCLLEPTSVAVRIADKTRIRVGERVLICGGGPIGQLALQVMRMYGATSLTMIEPIAERREMALRHGAEHVIDPTTEDQATRAGEITDGRGYDVVIDASGSPRAVRGLLDLAAKGGTVVYSAMYPETFEMPLNLSDYLYLKELTLTGVFVSPYAFPRALQVLPHLDIDELTTAVFPLERAVDAFAAHVGGRHPKVVIRCNDLGDD